ncbi:3-oxo-5-alpha-steroid 4-dehydrogenase-domain-containing protein [Xylogone sp. PMI_703]|nr:3-oxo-5-alpha-steroid 4-dehydrogenase-domain-containing protein [Xylogone sp. PMI_703]
MAGTLKVSSRSPKRPIRKLPATVDVSDTTTVQDVKTMLAKPGRWDPERLGIYGPDGKLIKDRKARISNIAKDGQEITVKDLGYQISWRTVFVIEYLGPILIHAAFLLLRPYIYSNLTPLSFSQKLSAGMIILHFLKREYETLFVHRFSLNSMPARNIFKNCGHYWVLSGVLIAYFIYAPNSYGAQSTATIDIVNGAGVALYLYGEIANAHTHRILSNLRSPGGTERGIPHGLGFDLVTCPNYLFEMLSWFGVAVVARTWSMAVFLVVAYGQMHLWAIKKEKAYRKEFPDKYKKKKSVIFPNPIDLLKALTS